MQTATQSVTRQLDMLYGLYELALDLCKSITPTDDDGTIKRIKERERLLLRTSQISEVAQVELKTFSAIPGIPANERALVEEKRQMILDVLARISQAEHQTMKAMHATMVSVRHELMQHTEKSHAISAYRNAPVAMMG